MRRRSFLEHLTAGFAAFGVGSWAGIVSGSNLGTSRKQHCFFMLPDGSDVLYLGADPAAVEVYDVMLRMNGPGCRGAFRVLVGHEEVGRFPYGSAEEWHRTIVDLGDQGFRSEPVGFPGDWPIDTRVWTHAESRAAIRARNSLA